MTNLKQAHESFIKFLKSKGRASATILAYGKDIEQLIDFLTAAGKTEPKAVKTEDIQKFMAKLQAENYTAKSISRKTNSTKTFFKFLKAEGLLTTDPSEGIIHPKFENKAPRILTKTEYRALRDAARNDPRTLAVVEILLQTGVRISELANIRLTDLKFAENHGANGELNVLPIENRPGRVVPLNPAAQKAIKDYLAERPKVKDDHLFVTKTGRPLLVRNIRATMGRYFRVAGIQEAKVNDLRHTFVANHLRRGVNLLLLSKIVGHKRVSTTEKYLEYIERPEQEVTELEEL